MATASKNLNLSEVLDASYNNGAIQALDDVGGYVDAHLAKFKASPNADALFGVITMLTSIQTLTTSMKAMYLNPERDEQILEEVKRKHTAIAAK